MPPAEPYPPSESRRTLDKGKRLQNQIDTIVVSTFRAIEDTKNPAPAPLKRKYCNKLRGMGIPDEHLPDWCNSAEARAIIDLAGEPVTPGAKTGNPDLDALEGGRSTRRRRRVKKTMKKNRKRMTRKK